MKPSLLLVSTVLPSVASAKIFMSFLRILWLPDVCLQYNSVVQYLFVSTLEWFAKIHLDAECVMCTEL
jgi:hypothetical protein